MKYETVFNWLCVAFNKKETFWKQLERDYKRGALDCYEARLEEIINKCTSATRKYWKNQIGIASRKKRTKLFQSDIFKERRKCSVCDNFGFHARPSFNHQVFFKSVRISLGIWVIDSKEGSGKKCSSTAWLQMASILEPG
jgi:hypothetical protein